MRGAIGRISCRLKNPKATFRILRSIPPRFRERRRYGQVLQVARQVAARRQNFEYRKPVSLRDGRAYVCWNAVSQTAPSATRHRSMLRRRQRLSVGKARGRQDNRRGAFGNRRRKDNRDSRFHRQCRARTSRKSPRRNSRPQSRHNRGTQYIQIRPAVYRRAFEASESSDVVGAFRR